MVVVLANVAEIVFFVLLDCIHKTYQCFAGMYEKKSPIIDKLTLRCV